MYTLRDFLKIILQYVTGCFHLLFQEISVKKKNKSIKFDQRVLEENVQKLGSSPSKGIQIRSFLNYIFCLLEFPMMFDISGLNFFHPWTRFFVIAGKCFADLNIWCESYTKLNKKIEGRARLIIQSCMYLRFRDKMKIFQIY